MNGEHIFLRLKNVVKVEYTFGYFFGKSDIEKKNHIY